MCAAVLYCAVLCWVVNYCSVRWGLVGAVAHGTGHNDLKREVVTTTNVATPGNVAKKTLPENVANFVGGYIFGKPHTQKCSRA